MISMSKLIARRLDPARGALDESTDDPKPASSYGASRLGLTAVAPPRCPLPPLRLAPPPMPASRPLPGGEKKDAPLPWPAAEPVAAQAPPPFRRTSFKLPTALHEALRRRARQTGRFQYQLVTEALQQFIGDSD